jgi:phenylacetate-CoA ligase
LTIHSSTAEQADWLQRQQPGYLLSYPSALNALARYCLKNNIRLPSLQQIRTFGEVLEPETRVACREAWGVPVVDVYSSEEFGYLAMQCPDHEHYHVQSENVLVEVLDDGGRSCAAGEIGRVVVTSLHNFGMPLLRYDIGDYAEVGPPCDCGRGLPVLRRILGRQRNMFVLPDGQTRWPMFDASALASVFQELPPIRQFQITQRTTTEIDVNLVSARPLTGEEEEHIRHYLQRGLGYAFAVAFCYVDEIPRTRRGKFEEFRSQVPLPR